jgi:hypothetical protein
VSDTDTRQDRQQEETGQSRINAREAAQRAIDYLNEMTGQEPEVVISVEPTNGHWHVQMELLELSRIPETTDVLGCYEVDLDSDGEPQGFHRTRRYHRGRVGEH